MAPKKFTSPGYRGYTERPPVGTRNIKPRFLIICEGAKTERNYFDAFRVPGLARGLGCDPKTLVESVEGIISETGGNYDQIWCVFDRDDVPSERFNSAIEIAKHKGYGIAYSNEAFELWYVLHFEYLESGLPRKDYIQKLSKYLGKQYEKNSETIYDDLFDKQATAIKRAQKLLASYPHPSPANDNPSTTVHQLVLELNQASGNNSPRGRSRRSS